MSKEDRKLFMKYIDLPEDGFNKGTGKYSQEEAKQITALIYSDNFLIKDGLKLLNKLGYKQYTLNPYKKFKDQINNAKQLQERFVLNEDNCPQQINHALGFIYKNKEKWVIDKDIGKRKDDWGKQRYRYYGALLVENVEKYDKKKKEYSTITKRKPVIILDNGTIVSDTDKKDYFFEFETEMSLKNNRWKLGSINNFIQNPKKPVSLMEVYKRYKSFYDGNIIFEYPEYYIMNAVWDMLTYFQDMFDKYLLIKHEGVSDSAKSKGMKISANLSFNGRKFLCPNPANFFRYRNNNKATLYIEEAEKLFADKKNRDDSVLVEYLNGSYEKGNYVPRQDDKDLNKTLEFDPAGFTRIGAIKPLKGALLKRTIVQSMIKAPSGDARSETEVPTEQDGRYSTARNMMYISALQNHEQFENALKNTINDYGLKNRAWLQIKPMLALAKCIDYDLPEQEKIETTLGNFLFNLIETRDDGYSEDSWEVKMGKGILTYFENNLNYEQEDFIPNEQLRDIFQREYNQYTETSPDVSTRAISTLMGNMGFGDCRGRGTGGVRGFKLSRNKVIEVLHRNEIILNSSKIASLTSLTSLNPDITNKIIKIESGSIVTLGKEVPLSLVTLGKEVPLNPRTKWRSDVSDANYNPPQNQQIDEKPITEEEVVE